ncbi:uncharacterized protein JCM15063_005524 [Sporobolomyces koalae]|uniref:uncharacterized protein n=1 Tax=Sporobolomyces koalae TaxID=500713 RepID=UPI00316D5CF9
MTASTSSIPPPQDYGHIVRSIQRRSADRLSGEHSPASWRLRSNSTEGVGEGEGGADPNPLEADLKLAAEIGVALLQEKSTLQQRLDSMERSNQKLLNRLSTSVKENNQLQRRFEETVGNLEQADSSNRALLVSLEEDRKTISRLSADAGKLVATSTNLRNLQRTYDDTLQELAAERKRASAAESKAKKITERANELEARLQTAIADLEEMRQDKVLRNRKSGEALAQVRAKFARGDDERPGSDEGTNKVNEDAGTEELLKLVENLVTENNLLRSESMELHGLLESTRDEQIELRSTLAARDVVPEEDEEDVRRAENDEDDPPTKFDQRRLSLLSAASAPLASVTSPSLSQSGFEHDLSPAPASPAALAYNRGSTSPYFTQTSRFEPNYTEDSLVRPPSAVRRSSSLRGRRAHVGANSSSGPLNSGKIPIGRGRGHNRRSLSMDMSGSVQSVLGPPAAIETGPVPDSPSGCYSPPTRPASIFSNASEEPDTSTGRPRRHHRPLSLSLGPSLFPGVPENEPSNPVSPSFRESTPGHRRRSSQAPLVPSYSATDSLASAHSGLGLPLGLRDTADGYRRRPYLPSVDSGTQTSPLASLAVGAAPLLAEEFSLTSTPHRSPRTYPRQSFAASPKDHSAASNASVSEISDERLFEAHVVSGTTAHEQRTAALGQLIEHVVKLLTRLQTADIATQSKRLAKQNLPGGDVKHVAQANMKELVNEIDSMRDRFRRILEQERAAALKEPGKSVQQSSTESLINRKDFVSLVKLLRDLLFEASRLRSLVNRVQLEPALASRLGDLDELQGSVADPTDQALNRAGTAGGLLAPLSRLFGSTLSPGEHPTLTSRPSSAQLRAPPKRGGYSAVTSATVNVEFGKAAVRSSTTSSAEGTGTTSPSQPAVTRPDAPKRDISAIFAGSSNRVQADPWVVLPSVEPTTSAATPMPQPRRIPSRSPGLASVASSYLPFGRILASSYRPALSSTTNAVLDSIPHAPPTSHDPSIPSPSEAPSTLLERQLRPRGLSDSSIRSTFLAHGIANPHHRVLTPATLALSSEPTRIAPTTVVADSSASSALSTSPATTSSGLGAISALQAQLKADEGFLSVSSSTSNGGSLSRRSSATNLRSKPSQSRLREQIATPALSSSVEGSSHRSSASPFPDHQPGAMSTSPTPIQISPPSPVKRSTSEGPSTHDRNGTNAPSSSLFGTLASGWGNSWASSSASGTMSESFRERTRIARDQ